MLLTEASRFREFNLLPAQEREYFLLSGYLPFTSRYGLLCLVHRVSFSRQLLLCQENLTFLLLDSQSTLVFLVIQQQNAALVGVVDVLNGIVLRSKLFLALSGLLQSSVGLIKRPLL